MAIDPSEYRDSLHVWPVRGVLPDVYGVGKFIETRTEDYLVVAIDAKYRALPVGVSENDNASETELYNEIDRWPCAKMLVHHSSKGLRAKSGSRTSEPEPEPKAGQRTLHLILREHQYGGDAVVLDAAVRSFAPVEPLGLRWAFPVWYADSELDVTRVKGAARCDKQASDDAEADDRVLAACQTWKTRTEIRRKTSLGDTRRTTEPLNGWSTRAGLSLAPRTGRTIQRQKSSGEPSTHQTKPARQNPPGLVTGLVVTQRVTTTHTRALKGRAGSVCCRQTPLKGPCPCPDGWG